MKPGLGASGQRPAARTRTPAAGAPPPARRPRFTAQADRSILDEQKARTPSGGFAGAQPRLAKIAQYITIFRPLGRRSLSPELYHRKLEYWNEGGLRMTAEFVVAWSPVSRQAACVPSPIPRASLVARVPVRRLRSQPNSSCLRQAAREQPNSPCQLSRPCPASRLRSQPFPRLHAKSLAFPAQLLVSRLVARVWQIACVPSPTPRAHDKPLVSGKPLVSP